jgi:hypothetical protein
MAGKLTRAFLTALLYLIMIFLVIVFFGSGEIFIYEGF